MNIPIFIISLVDSPRRKIIAERLNGLGLEFIFFDAVYGKNLSDEDLSKIDYEFYPKNYDARKPLTLGEIGCAMSHIKLYEYLVENNIEQAIVLEDDAILSLYFKEILLDAMSKISPKYEILFLDHGKAKIYPFPKNLVERYRLARYISPS
ncbi:glycosyltransferase family 25 protein, partial [Rodentibacter ratti]